LARDRAGDNVVRSRPACLLKRSHCRGERDVALKLGTLYWRIAVLGQRASRKYLENLTQVIVRGLSVGK
jgi:hypothetical protein